MPKYSLKAAGVDVSFHIECSYKNLPETIKDLVVGLDNETIKPDDKLECLDTIEKKLEKHKEELTWGTELEQDYKNQKPLAQYINWIKETG